MNYKNNNVILSGTLFLKGKSINREENLDIIVTSTSSFEKEIKEYTSNSSLTSFQNFWKFIENTGLNVFLSCFEASFKNDFYNCLCSISQIKNFLNNEFSSSLESILLFGSFLEETYDRNKDIDLLLIFDDDKFFWSPKDEQAIEHAVKEKLKYLCLDFPLKNPVDPVVRFSSLLKKRIAEQDIFTLTALKEALFLKDIDSKWKDISDTINTDLDKEILSKLSIKLLNEVNQNFENSLELWGKHFKYSVYETVVKSIDSYILKLGYFPAKPIKLGQQLKKINCLKSSKDINELLELWNIFFQKRKELMNPTLFKNEISFVEYVEKIELASKIINKINSLFPNTD